MRDNESCEPLARAMDIPRSYHEAMVETEGECNKG